MCNHHILHRSSYSPKKTELHTPNPTKTLAHMNIMSHGPASRMFPPVSRCTTRRCGRHRLGNEAIGTQPESPIRGLRGSQGSLGPGPPITSMIVDVTPSAAYGLITKGYTLNMIEKTCSFIEAILMMHPMGIFGLQDARLRDPAGQLYQPAAEFTLTRRPRKPISTRVPFSFLACLNRNQDH